MKDFNRLEKHLNDLATKQEQNPPAFVWDKIDNELPKKKRKRRVLWFVLIGLLFSVTSGYLWINTKTISINSDIPTISYDRNADLVAFEKSNNTIGLNVTKENKEANLDVSIEQKAKALEIKESSINRRRVVMDEKKSTIILNSEELVNFNDRQSINEMERRRKETVLNNTSSAIYKPSETKTFFNSGDLMVLQNAAPEKNLKSNKTFSLIKEEKINEVKATFLETDALASSLILIPLSIKNLELDLKIQQPPIIESLDEDRERRLFMDFGALAGKHNTGIMERDTSAAFRTSTESNWYSWGLSTQVGLQINKNVYIKSGLEYIDSRDKFNFERLKVVLEETSDSTKNQFRISSATYFNIGDVTYKQLNIPLTLGGEIAKGKYKVGIEFTSLFNLMFATEGKIRTGDLEFSRVQDERTYKNYLGLGVRSAFTIGMDLCDKGSLYLKPTWSKYLGNTNNDVNKVRTNLSQYYLEIAYRQRF